MANPALIAAGIPAIVELLGQVTSLISALGDDADDPQAQAKLEGQMAKTKKALDDLDAKIAAAKAQGG